MANVKLDLTYSGVSDKEISRYSSKVEKICNNLIQKADDENEFVGWLNLPTNYDKKEFNRIKKAAKRIRKNSEVFVVIGIGGSYLGARAVIEALTSNFANIMPEETRKSPQIFFVGNSISPNYINELIDCIGDKDISINVISKSGTTTEPAIAFRLCKELLIKKYHEKAAERIFATTDAKKGALRNLATQEGYETFVVPDDIGGRYSWFTAVGLLPIACAGIDIDALMKGSYDAMNDCVNNGYDSNDAMKYANMRNLLYKTKQIEILVNFEPRLAYISEWWKQLYGESEGKEHKGIFPAGVDLTTDLHSMGQYIQDGRRNLFETVINVEESKSDIKINIHNGENYCKDGDLVLADASEDYDGIGKAVELINVGDNKIVSGLHTILARDTNKIMSLGFKGYLFNTSLIHNQIRVLANGFKVYGISKNNIYDLVELCTKVLSDNPLFFLINSYTTGISSKVLEDILNLTINKEYNGKVTSGEIGLPMEDSKLVLPCGIYGRWEN